MKNSVDFFTFILWSRFAFLLYHISRECHHLFSALDLYSLNPSLIKYVIWVK